MSNVNISELSKLIDLLNKKGVTQFTSDGLSLTLSGDVRESKYKRKQSEAESAFGDEDSRDWNDLSPEEQLFMSAGGMGPLKAE